MNILHTLPSIALSCGGPPRSVSQLCGQLTESDCSVSMLATLYPYDPVVPLSDKIRLHALGGSSKGRIGRLTAPSYNSPIQNIFAKEATDIVHHHGVWLKCTQEVASTSKKLGVPYVIAPRGMLEPWALNHSKWKKKLAWKLYVERSCRGASAFHATAESEAESIRSLGFTQPIAVIPNGVNIPILKTDPVVEVAPNSNVRTALFLSRINPKKGIPMLLDAWKKIAPLNWKLRIVGNDDSDHLPAVMAKIESSGLRDRVEIVGALFGQDQLRAYQDADVFVLPSYSENFGIVIAEALSHRLPVLTTTGCPWKELTTERCGWWVDPTPSGIEAGLRDMFATSSDEFAAMGERGRKLIEGRYLWPTIADNMLEFYKWLIHGGKMPAFVV